MNATNSINRYCPLLLGLLLAGCSVNPQPFVQYQSAVQEAQTGINAAMATDYTWTRTTFITDFAGNSSANLTQLVLTLGDGYAWTIPANPLYLEVKKAQGALNQLNQSITDYAGLLVKLSGNQLVSTDTFDQLAKDLNQNVNSAAHAFNLSPSASSVALFSTAASEAARLYIVNKQRSDLRKAIEENQDNIQQYSDDCISLIHTIRGSLKKFYTDRSGAMVQAFPKVPEKDRQQAVGDMLDLDEQFAGVMAILQELENTYNALPKAHANLAKAVENPKLDLPEIEQLYSSAKRLQTLYNTLKQPPSATAAKQ